MEREIESVGDSVAVQEGLEVLASWITTKAAKAKRDVMYH